MASESALRLPAFMPRDPVMWFSLVETIFSKAGVADDVSKYLHVASALAPHDATEVRDILIAPPENDKYDALKTGIIKRLGASQEVNTRRLLEREHIGDRKPSQFLRHLRSLAGSAVPDALLRTMWLEQLPRPMQMVLATLAEQSLDKVADVADAIADSTTPTPAIATTENPVMKIIEVLRSEIADLRQQMKASSLNASARHRGRSRSRSRRSRPRSRSNSASGMCWYHDNYGHEAHKCIPPCAFKSAENAGNASGSH
ncbi:uncharacterized protein LOC134657716 [Cydia amplana]|uniref:uncharacterized protein LOC134657716 n=1 Tax=Cydia amplana TaxID=1869771 RepID=UPI002FE67598